jgi:hypothetical protein
MKLFKWKALNLAAIVVFAASILSTFVYAINNNIVETSPITESKDFATSTPTEQIKTKKNNQEVKKDLSREDILKLYNQGYSLVDIQKAELLSAKCNLSTEEILKKKGKRDYKVTKKVSEESNKYGSCEKDTKKILESISEVKDYTKDYIIEDQSKSWEKVEKDLGIEISSGNGGDQ